MKKKDEILISKKKRGYGEIGRRYGLNWIEPWYGKTYQVRTFKFRETLELTMGNPEPNPVFRKQRIKKSSESENKKSKDRCRDSMEAVLTNGVNGISFR